MSEIRTEKPGRIDFIDAIRGLAILLMVVHHFMFDLVEFLGAPGWLFSNPILDAFHYIFAGVFVTLAGVSSRFSRSNVKRGLKLVPIAGIISLVTWLMDMPIKFGILHFMAVAMIFYGLTHKLWEKINEIAAPIIFTLLTAAAAIITERLSPVETNWLWPIGFTARGFSSSDYFPILPWIFVFLFGTWLGKIIREGRFPGWFYDVKVRPLSFVGRHALIIYVLHQPILYGITMLIRSFLH